MANNNTRFQQDLQSFCDATEKFYKKELNVAEYKKISGRYGSYAQRGGSSSMLRLRLAGGEINKENLKFIADSIETYQISLVHFSTCQTVQLHNLSKAQVCALAKEAYSHGIITLGGGGDYPRNVMCSPLSGIQKGEPFDVLPYAKEAARYLIGLIDKVKLPRKLKVCFSNNRENLTHATFRDLGFVATSQNTFDVYCAGGLGRSPRMGVMVASGISPAQTLYYVKAMVDTFVAYGNYENRAKSRTRFLQESLGVEGLRKAYQEKLDEALQEKGLDIQVSSTRIEKTRLKEKDEETLLVHPRILPQKQDGLYTVSYHPIGGCPDPGFFRTIYNAILPMEDVALRLSPEEGMYIVNLTAAEAKNILSLTEDGAQTPFESSVACIGASICQIGARDSQRLLKSCIERVRQEHFPEQALPKIRISGCPSSCSAHPVATLGFRGGVKQTPDGPKPAFAVYEHGCERQGQEQFGTELGIMAESEIPGFLVDLGRETTARGMDYSQFWNNCHDVFLEIANRHM
ncbi:nitrite/sulfite reductase [Lachnospiraceae bacterium 29-84]